MTTNRIEGSSIKQLYDNHQGKVSDKWLLYLEEYDRQFLPYRDKAVNLLEIGIQNGGSLEIWAKYFGNGQNIVGCDVNAICAGLRYDDPRVQVVVGDINSDATEKTIISYTDAYDIVIDDGSHMSGDIVQSFCRYFRLLKDGGIYVVEDLSCSYWQKYDGGLYEPFSSISFFKRIVDSINHEHWGIEKTSAELIHGFGERYGAAVDDELLGTVHSVEFFNSLCIVRKRDGVMNYLRDRVVVGQTAMVSPEVAALSGFSIPENQCDNPYSCISGDIEERYVKVSGELAEVKEQLQQYRERVAGLEKTIDDQSGTISSLYHKTETGEKQLATALDELREKQLVLQGMIDSLSWQVTKPVRKLLKSIRKRTKKVRKYVFRNEETATGNEG
ncbi:MAG: glycosyl transferase, partial [Clostridiales bacterium]|nr:glycosyl transferase [Clostridiales bacterium]